jgi:hypothetical protein
MAELHVQRKRSRYLWLWLLVAFLLIGASIFIYMHSNPKNGQADTTRPTSVLTFKNSTNV